MANPNRPIQNDLITPEWGQWVHDHIATSHGAAAHRAGLQTFQPSVLSAIFFDVTDRNVANCQTAPNAFYARVSGWYAFHAYGWFEGGSGFSYGTRRALGLRLTPNRVTPQTEQMPAASGIGETFLNFQCEIHLNVDDLVEVWAYQDSAVPLNLWNASMTMRFTIAD